MKKKFRRLLQMMKTSIIRVFPATTSASSDRKQINITKSIIERASVKPNPGIFSSICDSLSVTSNGHIKKGNGNSVKKNK